jgi:hypothetical protein
MPPFIRITEGSFVSKEGVRPNGNWGLPLLLQFKIKGFMLSVRLDLGIYWGHPDTGRCNGRPPRPQNKKSHH